MAHSRERKIFGEVSHDAPHLDKEFYLCPLSHPVFLSGPGNLGSWKAGNPVRSRWLFNSGLGSCVCVSAGRHSAHTCQRTHPVRPHLSDLQIRIHDSRQSAETQQWKWNNRNCGESRMATGRVNSEHHTNTCGPLICCPLLVLPPSPPLRV